MYVASFHDFESSQDVLRKISALYTVNLIIADNLGPLLLTRFNFNPGMEK